LWKDARKKLELRLAHSFAGLGLIGGMILLGESLCFASLFASHSKDRLRKHKQVSHLMDGNHR
jgi:hypothetical protein